MNSCGDELSKRWVDGLVNDGRNGRHGVDERLATSRMDRSAGEHHVGHDGHRVDVGRSGSGHRREQLGGHEQRCSGYGVAPVIRTGCRQVPHQAKVSELPGTIAVQHVSRLEVTMYKAPLVKVRKPIRHMNQGRDDLFGAHPAAGDRGEMVSKRAAAKFGDEERVRFARQVMDAGVQVADQVLVPKRCDLLDLSQKLVALKRGRVGMQHFDRSRSEADIRLIGTAKHPTEAAVAEQVCDPPTPADQFSGQICVFHDLNPPLRRP